MHEQGNLDLDYRRRCVVRADGHVTIYYGLTALDAYHWLGLTARDVTDDHAELSVGGRRTSNGAKHVQEQKHFFTKSLSRELAVQGRGDVGLVGARHASRGIGGAAQVEATEGSAGCGGRDHTEETCPGHVAFCR